MAAFNFAVVFSFLFFIGCGTAVPVMDMIGGMALQAGTGALYGVASEKAHEALLGESPYQKAARQGAETQQVFVKTQCIKLQEDLLAKGYPPDQNCEALLRGRPKEQNHRANEEMVREVADSGSGLPKCAGEVTYRRVDGRHEPTCVK